MGINQLPTITVRFLRLVSNVLEKLMPHTAIPKDDTVKPSFSMRLRAHQDVKDHWRIEYYPGTAPGLSSPDHPLIRSKSLNDLRLRLRFVYLIGTADCVNPSRRFFSHSSFAGFSATRR